MSNIETILDIQAKTLAAVERLQQNLELLRVGMEGEVEAIDQRFRNEANARKDVADQADWAIGELNNRIDSVSENVISITQGISERIHTPAEKLEDLANRADRLAPVETGAIPLPAVEEWQNPEQNGKAPVDDFDYDYAVDEGLIAPPFPANDEDEADGEAAEVAVDDGAGDAEEGPGPVGFWTNEPYDSDNGIIREAANAFPNHDIVLAGTRLGIKDPDDDVDPVTNMTKIRLIQPIDDDDGPPFDIGDEEYHPDVEVVA